MARKHARPFKGWRRATEQGPATTQYFQRLAHSPRSFLRSPIGPTAEELSDLALGSSRKTSAQSVNPPASFPGIYLRPSSPAGSLPSSAATGDFNGDGKTDWVVANAGDNSLGLYLGNGDGTSQLPVTLPLLGQSPLSVAEGELNGDHFLDLVVSEADSNSIGIFFGNGGGTFQPEVQIALPVQPMYVALADVNHDGHLDLLVATFDPSGVINTFFAVMLNDGSGHFAAPIYAPNPTPVDEVYGFSIAFGDVNGDGNTDVLVSGVVPLGTTLQLFFGKGDGTFTPGPAIWGSNGNPVFESDLGLAVIADLNGDGPLCERSGFHVLTGSRSAAINYA